MTSKCGKNKKVAWEPIKKNINIIDKIKFKIYTYTNACILGRVYVVERSTFIWLKSNDYSSWSGPLSVVLIFCELRSIFPSPAGARKNASNEQNVREYYMLNHLIRGLLFHYKKVLFCFNFIWKGCFKKMHHLLFRVRANDVNSTKSQPKIFIWWINKMTSDKRWQAKFFVLRWKQFLSFKNCRSDSICSVPKPVKPRHYSVLPCHILRVLLTKYGKMTQ